MKRLDDFLRHLSSGRAASPHTVRAYTGDLRQFGTWLATTSGAAPGDARAFACTDPTTAGPAEVRRWTVELLEADAARTTVARKVTAVRTFFKYLLREGVIDTDPTAALRMPRVRRKLPRALGSDEIARLLAAPIGHEFVAVRDRAALELLYSAGIRNAELVGLSVDDVDFEQGLARVHGKGNRERLAVVGSFARRAIEDYLPHRAAIAGPGSALFLNRFGTPLTDRSLRRVLERYLVRADLPQGTTPHTLRHTFATHLLENGAHLKEVQELLGHKHLSSTQIYTHLTPEHLRRVYEASHPRAHSATKPPSPPRDAP